MAMRPVFINAGRCESLRSSIALKYAQSDVRGSGDICYTNDMREFAFTMRIAQYRSLSKQLYLDVRGWRGQGREPEQGHGSSIRLARFVPRPHGGVDDKAM